MKEKRFEKESQVCYGMIILFAIMFFSCFRNENIWYDESFTINLAGKSFADIWRLTALDVHPPFYYFCVKIMMYLFGDSFAVIRLVSYLPILGMQLYGVTAIQREFQRKVSILFVAFTCFMPVMIHASLEMRMYALSCLLTFLTGYYAYICYRYDKISAWFKLGIFCILAAYTHYYALMTVGYIGLCLLIFICKKKRVLWKRWCITFGAAVVVYSPWISNVIWQVRKVSGNYWIEKITLYNILSYVVWPFHLSSNDLISIIFTVIVGCIAIKIFFVVRKQEKKTDIWAAIFAIAVFVLVVLTGIFCSIIIRPVFVARYMMTAVGLLWLGMAILITRCEIKMIYRGMLIGLLVIALINSRDVYREEMDTAGLELQEFIADYMPESAHILSTHGHCLGIFSVYAPERAIYTMEYGDQWAVFDNLIALDSYEDFFEHPIEEKWVLASDGGGEGEIIEKYPLELVYELYMEGVHYSIYKVE